MMEIYRSENPGLAIDTHCPSRHTMRFPGNVPYIVDNLWEWKRPDEMPNRRHSVYASPSPELAAKLGRKDGAVYKIEVCGSYKLAQLQQYEDSKYHPECKTLKKDLLSLLGMSGRHSTWHKIPLSEKTALGQLWIPGLTKEQIDELFEKVEPLNRVKEEIHKKIRYWDDIVPLSEKSSLDQSGEIFFESDTGYMIKRIVSD